jgi:hypothetical protein
MFQHSLRFSGVLGVLLGVLMAASLAPTQQSDTSPAKKQPPPAAAGKQSTTTSNYARSSEPTPPRINARGTPARGKVHRIEEYRGSSLRVRYFLTGDVSAQERATARELERAENEKNYLDDLGNLKQQYVNDERIMEPFRRGVQQQLYGTSVTSEGDSTRLGGAGYGSSYGGFPGYGLYGGFPGYGLYGGFPGYGLYGGFPGYGWGGYGYRQGVLGGYLGHSQTTVKQSLENGVGDEGRMKTAIAPAIAAQLSPEYAEQAEQHYEKAMTRAASSPTLAKALHLRPTDEATASRPSEPSYAKDSTVTVWAGNDKYTGVVMADRPGWVVLKTDEGEMTLRKSTIERSLVRSKPTRSQEGGTVSQRR